MKADDKKIKRIFKELKVPVSYEERVDDMLAALKADAAKEEGPAPKKMGKYILRTAVCLVCVCVMLSAMVLHSNADLWAGFRQSLMDFLGFSSEQEAEGSGVNSAPMRVEAKKDLFVELQEAVIDAHNIYLLVRITAPTDIAFTDKITFDYFGFCTGENYDVNKLLAGSRDCKLLEVMDGMSNAGLYVVSICFEQTLSEETPVTCFLKDLTDDPNGESPELLVEGMWSLTFPFHQTIVDNVTIKGGPDASFPYMDGTAAVESIELTPTSLVLTLDASNLTLELMNVTDTTVAIRLAFIDGSEKVIVSHDPNESFIQGGSIYIGSEDDPIQKQTLEFAEILNIAEVTGVYIEDLYFPLK